MTLRSRGRVTAVTGYGRRLSRQTAWQMLELEIRLKLLR